MVNTMKDKLKLSLEKDFFSQPFQPFVEPGNFPRMIGKSQDPKFSSSDETSASNQNAGNNLTHGIVD